MTDELKYPDQIPCEVVGRADELPDRLRIGPGRGGGRWRWGDFFATLEAIDNDQWHQIELGDADQVYNAQMAIHQAVHVGKLQQRFRTRTDGKCLWVQRKVDDGEASDG